MSSQSQIFKQKIPNELFVQFLESIAVKTDKSYVIDNNVYKKGVWSYFWVF